MRITFRIDCSPNEFRRFCGEPDVTPLLHALVLLLDGCLRGRIDALDPNAPAGAGTRCSPVPKARG